MALTAASSSLLQDHHFLRPCLDLSFKAPSSSVLPKPLSLKPPAKLPALFYPKPLRTGRRSLRTAPATRMAIISSLPVVSPPVVRTLYGPRGLVEWRQRKEEAAVRSGDVPEGASAGDPFLAMLAGGALRVGVHYPAMGVTAGGSPTFRGSGNSCLDFFYQVVPDTPADRMRTLLAAAWSEDPRLALKLLFQLRGVRGTGKAEREGFYTGALWLGKEHPGTLLTNLKQIALFGYYKDLLEIVLRTLEGPVGTAQRAAQKDAHDLAVKAAKARGAKKRAQKRSAQDIKALGVFASDDLDDWSDYGEREYDPKMSRKGAAARQAKRAGTLRPREERIAEQLERDRELSNIAREARHERRFMAAERAVRAYTYNGSYRALHDAVADIFAQQLAQDLRSLAEGKERDISLAAKWAPSLNGSYDRQILLCEAIARRMFPAPEGEKEDAAYVSRARDRLRKEVLTPLRAALKLPETYAAAKRWREVDYRRVGSHCMRANKRPLLRHDGKRFRRFLADVRAGKVRLASRALLPHEVLREAVTSPAWSGSHVADLQWRGPKRPGADPAARARLTSCLPVCDVSSRMQGAAVQAALALGQLTSEIAEAPWKGQIITFSASPQMHALKGRTVKERYSGLAEGLEWRGGSGFQKVFDNVLALAKAAELPPEAMVRRLIVFSGMEFDAASAKPSAGTDYDAPYGASRTRYGGGNSDYMEIERKFADAGYGAPPEIVFWKLSNSESTPVSATQKRTALVSGFSRNLLKLVLDSVGEAIDPLTIMHKAVAGPEYKPLVVVD